MKLVCKYTLLSLILMSSSVQAREVVLIENQASLEEGILLKSILLKKFHIPRELITLKNINEACEKSTEAIIHLCLLKSGDLQIKKMNQYVVENSLGVFLNQDNAQEDSK